MPEDFPPTVAELELLKMKLVNLLANTELLDGSVERQTVKAGLVCLDAKLVGLRALIAAATDPNFKNCA